MNLNISSINSQIPFELINDLKINDRIPENFNFLKTLGNVKNQGSCGSCYTFSTVANLESQYYIKYRKHLTFSEQNIIDCDYIDNGCNGGLMENTFTWIKNNGGIMLQNEYPYKGTKGVCLQNKRRYAVKVLGYKKLNSENEDLIKTFLYQNGPLSIALNANTLQYYQGGIIDYNSRVCPSQINHAVTLVGAGISNGKKYWLIRNSWGEDWGEKGYFRIARGKGTCGINKYITTSVIS